MKITSNSYTSTNMAFRRKLKGHMSPLYPPFSNSKKVTLNCQPLKNKKIDREA